MTKSKPRIKLPGNPYDAVNVVAQRIKDWNKENPDYLLVTCPRSVYLSIDYEKYSRVPYCDEWDSQFCLLSRYKEDGGEYIALPYDTLNKRECERVRGHHLEYILWMMADWDLSEYPYYYDRVLIPSQIIHDLEDWRIFEDTELSIWNYILPGFRTEEAFKEWVDRHGFPKFEKYGLTRLTQLSVFEK